MISLVEDRATSSSDGKLLEKKTRWRRLPMVRALGIEAIRDIIISFVDMSSYFPLLDLSMTPLTERCKEIFDKHFLGYFEVGENKRQHQIGTLPCLRWHSDYWISMKLTQSPPVKDVSSTINLYDKEVSLHDLDWYFKWRGTYEWERIRTGKDPEYSLSRRSRDSDDHHWRLLSVEWGFISIDDLPEDYMNVVRPINMGRWDIADKYMKRGKCDITREVAEYIAMGLSYVNLERFVSTYDVWDIFAYLKMMKGIEVPLLRGGILQRSFVQCTAINPVSRLPVPLWEVPMNVVEDLFALSMLRGNRYATDTLKLNEVLENIESIFFEEIRRSKETERKKSVSASACHRWYKIKYIDNIIRRIRLRSPYPQGDIRDFLYSRNLVKEGYIFSNERWALGS